MMIAFKFVFYSVAYLSLWCCGPGVSAADFDNQLAVERSAALSLIPDIARGNEEIYQHFLRGVLIYRPHPGSDEGRIDMPIANLRNPLEGKFDLSRCGDAGEYLTISTGYRKGEKWLNINKLEVWIVPKFVVEKDIEKHRSMFGMFSSRPADHYKAIMGAWTASYGIFYNRGSNSSVMANDYLITARAEEISSKNLFDLRPSNQDGWIGAYHSGPKFSFNFPPA